jgi:Lipase (class 3)
LHRFGMKKAMMIRSRPFRFALKIICAGALVCPSPLIAETLQGGVRQNDFSPPPAPPGKHWIAGDQDMGPCNAQNEQHLHGPGAVGGICKNVPVGNGQTWCQCWIEYNVPIPIPGNGSTARREAPISNGPGIPPYVPPVSGGVNVCSDPNASRIPQCKQNGRQAVTRPRPPTPQRPRAANLRICTAAQLASVDFERYNTGLPISIARVEGAASQRSYVIFLAGTEFKASQSNSVATDFSEAADVASRYDIAVMDAIINTIPPGSELMFVGHSLGGMVAQNLARRFARAGFYDGKLRVTRIITFGSPKTGQDVPGIAYRRFVIFGDPVPSLSWPLNGPAAGVTVIDGGRGSHLPLVGEHLAYPQSQALQAFDALGELGSHECLRLQQQSWTYPAAAR